MLKRTTRLTAFVGICIICTMVACSGQIQFEIAGRTITLSFGPDGLSFDVQRNQTTAPQAASFRLFDNAPSSTPPSGTMTLAGSNVRMGQVLTAKEAVRSQGALLSGSATVRFYIASGQSAALCDTATLLAEYELTLVAGALSVADEVYELSQEALSVVVTNDVTICVEVTADFDGQISIFDFSLSFGGGDTDTAAFTMFNTDIENIHIMLPGEDFDESNRISPDSVREATLTGVGFGESITVRAGRNGQVLDSTTCPAVTGANYTATVEWDGWSVTCDAEQTGGGGEPIVPPGTTLQVPIDAYGDAAKPTETYAGIDYALTGVLDVNSSTQYPPSLPSNVTSRLGIVTVDLAELGLQYVERLYFASHGAWVPDLPNGLAIATLTCEYAEGGSPTVLDMTMGSTTAEWSWDRPDHDINFGGPPHSLIPILYSFPTVSIMGYAYDGHIFSVDLATDTSRTLSSISLELVDPATYQDLRNPASLGPMDWAGQGIVAMTLVGPAGTSSGGGGVQPGTGSGTVHGQVVDAQTGDPLPGALISVLGGTSPTATSDSSGNFTISNVPEGGQTLVATATGYVETSVPIVMLANATVEISIGMLALGAGGDNVAAVLAWGENPRDLDLHMSGPDGSGGQFHAFYRNKEPAPHVFLDLDDTQSFGPETMTVRPAESGSYVAGDYHVWIHHYAGDLTFAESQATVTLFAGGSQIAQYTVGSGSGDSSQRIWLVVEFDVSATGAVSNVRLQQSFTEGSADSVF